MNKQEISFENVFTIEHLYDSAKECMRNVRWKYSTQLFELNLAQWLYDLRKDLFNGDYKSKGFSVFYIKERGKERKIQSVHITERVVQKCLVQYALRPSIVPTLIYDNGASLSGKGTDFSLKRLRKHLASHYRKNGLEGGILLADIKNYFGSIPHDRVHKMFEYYVKDERLLKLSNYFIDCFKGNVGIGLGSEISQIAAITYVNHIDHYMKERMHIKGYARYMDDIYMIHEDVEYLKECKEELEKMLNSLGLKLNEKTRIVNFNKGYFTFLKRRFHITETGKIKTEIDKKKISGMRQKLKRMHDKEVPLEEALQTAQCLYSYANKWESSRIAKQISDVFVSLWDDGQWITPDHPLYKTDKNTIWVKNESEIGGGHYEWTSQRSS